MVVKVNEKNAKTRQVKNKDEYKNYKLWGGRNVKYHDRVLSIKMESYNLT